MPGPEHGRAMQKGNPEFYLLTGDLIDIGGSRKVFSNIEDAGTEIKVLKSQKEKNKTKTPIEIEWMIWNKYQSSQIAQFLCPCVAISPDKIYLVQKKAQMLKSGNDVKNTREIWKLLPNEIKNVPDSRWYKNWGFFDHRYVLVDYGKII